MFRSSERARQRTCIAGPAPSHGSGNVDARLEVIAWGTLAPNCVPNNRVLRACWRLRNCPRQPHDPLQPVGHTAETRSVSSGSKPGRGGTSGTDQHVVESGDTGLF